MDFAGLASLCALFLVSANLALPLQRVIAPRNFLTAVIIVLGIGEWPSRAEANLIPTALAPCMIGGHASFPERARGTLESIDVGSITIRVRGRNIHARIDKPLDVILLKAASVEEVPSGTAVEIVAAVAPNKPPSMVWLGIRSEGQGGGAERWWSNHSRLFIGHVVRRVPSGRDMMLDI